MTTGTIIALLRDGVFHIVMLITPVLLAALIVGLIVAILQATTSIQEQTLTFVPKMLTILGMLALLGGWMLTTMQSYTKNLFEYISQLTHSSGIF